MVTQANTKLVYHALKRLDLYVVKDFWMTPSAELADYVLPSASWLERPQHWTYVDYAQYLSIGERALAPIVPGECEHRDDYEFWRDLGIRLGQGEHWPWQSLEDVYDYRLQGMGYSHREFVDKVRWIFFPFQEKKYERIGFGTSTGKVELYSMLLERLLYDPLPSYEEPRETPVGSPDLANQYPLMLITGMRHDPFFHSEHRQIESLRRLHPDPLVQVHPDTAQELGIGDGEWVWIETPRGRVRQKCQYFDGIHPKVVSAQHGWWFPELPGEEPWLHGVWESNINVVTDDDPDACNQVIGGWPLRTALCRLYKVKRYD
jgi:anaerobic selenocysteine-containing dehydrogenase